MGDQISQSDQLISSMLQHSSHLECVTLVFSRRQCCAKQNNFLIRQSQGNRIEKSLNRYLPHSKKKISSGPQAAFITNRGKRTLYERRNLTSDMICLCFMHILYAPHAFVCTKSCQCNKTFNCEYSAHALLCLLFLFAVLVSYNDKLPTRPVCCTVYKRTKNGWCKKNQALWIKCWQTMNAHSLS